MRIHRLEMVAFGPFADRVSIDLDTLSDAGLFLLTGATGAGKTSILDAVAFALYGAVPGDRQAAKRLRSDHATPDVAPEVSCELTVAGRRLRISRSPSWERPKKRGRGTTTEQARVLVEERVDGSWRPLATRLDEAGHLVVGLLGMNLSQFCQVQLLPQGRFQAFLRADSAERHELLQQLFRTSRFEDVESWLRERRRRLRREADRLHDSVTGLVSRLSEASGSSLPSHWDLHRLDPVAAELGRWSGATLEQARDARQDTAARAALATEAESAARAAHDAAGRLREQQLRLERARAEHLTLRAERAVQQERLDRIDGARRAAGAAPALAEAARAAADLEAASAGADAAYEEAARLLGTRELEEHTLRTRLKDAAAGAARARALVPLVSEQERLTAEIEEKAAETHRLTHELDRVTTELAEHPAALAAARAREEMARRAAVELPAARQAATDALDRLEAALLLEDLATERTEAVLRHREAVDEAQTLRESWLDLQERRLTGMAAEIALGLAVGASCPVCGSDDHPRPAQPAPGAPDAHAEREARRRVDDAEAERHARAGAVRDLEVRMDLARERSGGRAVSDLQQEADETAATEARVAELAQDLEPASDALRDVGRAHELGTTRRTDLLARLTTVESARAQLARRVDAIDAELDRALAGTGCCSVSALGDLLDRTERVCSDALAAEQERTRTGRAAAAAADRADHQVRAQGFGCAAVVEAALLSDAEVTELGRLVRDHDLRVAAVEAVLADPELVAAAELDPPDLHHHRRSLTEAEEESAAAGAAALRANERVKRLELLHDDLLAAVSAWEPVRDDLTTTDGLTTLVEGTSPDNRLRMRLSGYVLAYRLRQVVDAANERLTSMTDGRYHLEHTGDRGAREKRGGLSLLVRDDWTGGTRDPVTLSGGETFVVSLALALGLADVISYEAGGAELDTLFVDEGFGTLDADTLDDVMEMLDTLRDGGRVVGVVSHVAELRDRIPTQLQVRKQRTGSTIHQEAVG